QPDAELVLSPQTAGVLTFPRDFSSIDLRGHRVQAVARFNPVSPLIGTGPGNGYSDVAVVPGDGASQSLTIGHIVRAELFEETPWTKLLRVRSKLLSAFHGREVFLQAAVVLPASYDVHPQRRFPTIFIVPGFSGTHRDARRSTPILEQNDRGVEFLRVTLDPSCPLGHHAFADSANNGPVGEAFVAEFIPEYERRFRSLPEAGARFLTGHSSGGWSTLWLQISYPGVFGGVWSTAPDPVDFRDFQRVNLYEPGENMYVDREGRRRPLARIGGQTVLWFDDFDWMEHVLGPGGQLHSFEAVFSPRDSDGNPRRLWDRRTGAIDTTLAQSWEQYDIRRQLERRWDELAPELRGKLHVFMGTEDTFLLDGAARLLRDSLANLGSDAVVELHPGRDHRNLMTAELRNRIRAEMAARFLEKFPDWPVANAPP
ncbi:MAG: alpha/beta hydrolase-fold protein, partial [Planctomycetaceae bacterium]